MTAALYRLGVALAIGLIIGAEREQRKTEGPDRAAAGIRTFSLAALAGGVAALAGVWLTVALGVGLAALAVAAYALGDRTDPGVTTELVLLLSYALGVLAQSQPAAALAAGVASAAVLAARAQLHSFLAQTLSPRELRDALVLGVAAVVLLPLIPDRPVGPFRALNLHTLWRLAVVMMLMEGLGYVAQRTLGSRVGLALAGVAGGFVSGLATIGAMGARAKGDAKLSSNAVAGACASMVTTFVLLAVVVGVADASMLARLRWPLGLGGVTAALYALAWGWRTVRTPTASLERGRAFKWSSAIVFAGLVGGVALLAELAARQWGEAAVPITALLGGFADAHAAAASAAALHADGRVSEEAALAAVVLALSANTLTKGVVAFTAGPRPYFRRVAGGLLLITAATWLGFGLATAVGP